MQCSGSRATAQHSVWPTTHMARAGGGPKTDFHKFRELAGRITKEANLKSPEELVIS